MGAWPNYGANTRASGHTDKCPAKTRFRLHSQSKLSHSEAARNRAAALRRVATAPKRSVTRMQKTSKKPCRPVFVMLVYQL